MKKIGCFILTVCFIQVAIAQSEKVNWQSFKDVADIAKDTQKNILIYIHTDWCVYCKIMDKQIFRDTAIAYIINKKLLPLKLNAEQKDSIVFFNKTYYYLPNGNGTGIHELALLLANNAGIEGYPQTIILNPKKEIIFQYSGLLKKKEWLLLMGKL